MTPGVDEALSAYQQALEAKIKSRLGDNDLSLSLWLDIRGMPELGRLMRAAKTDGALEMELDR